MYQKLLITCRVRPSNVVANGKQQINRSPPSKQGQKINRAESPSFKDFRFSVFTSSCCNPKFKVGDNSPQLVIASENPIKAQLLEKYISSDDDLVKYRNSILGSVDMFEFDKVYGIKTQQDRLYIDLCKERISECINGHSSTFILLGPNGGGKQFTFRGGDNNEKGIMMNAAEDLINLISISKQGARPRGLPKDEYDNFQLQLQIFCIANNEIIDLLQVPNKRNQNLKKPIGTENIVDDVGSISSQVLSNSLQFRNLFRQSVNILISSTADNDRLIHNAHFVIRFQIYKNKENLSQATFVKLSDFTKNSQQEMNILQKFLVEISSSRRGRVLSNPQYFETQLVKVLSETLNKLNDNSAVILANVESLPQAIKNTVSALQFCQILRKKIQTVNADSALLDKSAGTDQAKEDKHFELLCQEIDDAVNHIFQYSNETKGFNEFERREWILNQEKKILQIENQIPQAADTNNKQFLSKESKLQEAKKFLRDLKKYPSIPNFQSTSNINLKDPQSESYEGDFQSLLNKYNQQKQIQIDPRIHSVSTVKNNEEASAIADLKKSLMEKIDKTIQESPNKLNKTNELLRNASNLNETKEEQRILLAKFQQLEEGIKRRDRVIANYELEINEQRKERDNEKDILMRRLTKQELITKSQEELLDLIESMKIKLQRKREAYNKLMENYRVLDSTTQDERKKQIDDKLELEKQLDFFKGQFDEQRIRSTELQKLLDQTRKDFEISAKKSVTLEQNFSDADWRFNKLQAQLHQEQDIAKELKITTQIQEKKLEDYQIKLKNLEEKLFKQKKKYDQDTIILQEDRDNQIDKRKKKASQMKGKLKDLSNQLQQLSQDGQQLQLENEKLLRINLSQNEQIQMREKEFEALHSQATQLQIEYNKLKEQNADLDILLKKEADEVNRLQRMNVSQQQELDQKNNQNKELLDELEALRKQTDDQLIEIKDFTNQNQAQADLINKLEQQNNMLQEIQNKEITQMEEKINMVNRELIRLRDENVMLVNNQNNLMSQLHQADQTIEQQEEKLARFKLVNKQLRENIEELDERVKELISEKNHEIRELQTVEYRTSAQKNRKAQYQNEYETEFNQSRRSKLKDIMRNLENDDDEEDENQDQQQDDNY